MPDETRAAVPSEVYEDEKRVRSERSGSGRPDAVRREHDRSESEDTGLFENNVFERTEIVDIDRPENNGTDRPENIGTERSENDAIDRFAKVAGADYDGVNDFLRGRVAFTAREWAVARLCADFRTGTGVEMTNVGEHLPELVPFMDEAYTPQAVCAARRSFVDKVREAGATVLYGAYADFLTADEVDGLLYEATEVAKFLVEVEGATLTVDRELEAERGVREAMGEVHRASLELRYDRCPHCDEVLGDATE